ncbi:glycosyltransferase [Alkalilimnicola sp. S0819]|uniref:glycosyltransferase n=1 Tax=Alkalilimnicola sp. S0819 TaxID=2613922 RepID=UPI0012617B45|nr:glycosyltransferase [Alkalilimnicola sp. S0819]KAB7622855.1 glycosyltransferase [Alkalilimnicola sp. S0819]MPQ17177.1 glycosyltransferase [Alkalilimnicola sp. S0819]
MAESHAHGVMPRVTVMVPVRNEARYIKATLSQLAEQDYPAGSLEILVLDGDSEDDTAQRVQAFATAHPGLNLRLLRNPRRLSSAARNLALAHGRGDYFLLIDGHVHIPGRRMIRDHVEMALAHGALVLGRPQPLDPPGITSFQQAVALARRSRLAHSGESLIFSNRQAWCSPLSVAVFYHRSVFERCGRFDERFDAAEDLEFNYRLERAGLRCLISPRFTVRYYPRENLSGLFRQLVRYGLGRGRFLRKHPMRLRPEMLAPPLLLLGLVVGVLGSLFSGWWLGLFVLALAAYALLLEVEARRLVAGQPGQSAHRLALIIATIHLGLGYGLLRGLLTPWPTVQAGPRFDEERDLAG